MISIDDCIVLSANLQLAAIVTVVLAPISRYGGVKTLPDIEPEVVVKDANAIGVVVPSLNTARPVIVDLTLYRILVPADDSIEKLTIPSRYVGDIERRWAIRSASQQRSSQHLLVMYQEQPENAQR